MAIRPERRKGLTIVGQDDVVRILGAGPAGLTAAITLAKAGRRVMVFDRRADVGGRFNDDYQGLENWTTSQDVVDDVLAMGIDIRSACHPIYQGTIYNPSLRSLDVSSATPIVYLVRRGGGMGTLDTVLKMQALAVGVELHFGVRMNEQDADVVASGPRGVGAVAAGITFRSDLPDGAYAIASDYFAPKGYAYLLIADGRATLATVLYKHFSKASKYLQRSLKGFSSVLRLGDLDGAKYWGGYGNFAIPKSAMVGGRLWVGEAAGFQDYLFGFGIRLGMISAHIAAKSILDGSDYDANWQRRLAPLLKASFANRFLYDRLGRLAYHLLWMVIGKSRQPVKFMRWLYSWTLSRQVVYPIASKMLR